MATGGPGWPSPLDSAAWPLCWPWASWSNTAPPPSTRPPIAAPTVCCPPIAASGASSARSRTSGATPTVPTSPRPCRCCWPRSLPPTRCVATGPALVVRAALERMAMAWPAVGAGVLATAAGGAAPGLGPAGPDGVASPQVAAGSYPSGAALLVALGRIVGGTVIVRLRPAWRRPCWRPARWRSRSTPPCGWRSGRTGSPTCSAATCPPRALACRRRHWSAAEPHGHQPLAARARRGPVRHALSPFRTVPHPQTNESAVSLVAHAVAVRGPLAGAAAIVLAVTAVYPCHPPSWGG